MGFMDRILKAGEGKKVKAIAGLVPEINSIEPEMEALSDSDLMTIDGGASDHVAAYGRWFYQGDINGYARYTQSGATLDVAK